VAAFDVLKLLPIFSVLVWFALAALQIYRDRIRTSTERFFLLACFFTGLYAMSDLAFFNSPSHATARFLASLSVTAVTLSAVFFFMFTQAYIGTKGAWFSAYLLPPGLLVPLIWTSMIQDLAQPEPGGLFFPVFNPYIFAIWLVIIVAYASKGLVNVYRLRKILKEQNPRLGKRVLGILSALLLTFFLGLSTNGYLGALQNTNIPPPFSTLFVIPGIFVSATLYPGARGRVSEAMRRFRARRYTIQSGFLVYNDGTLIGSLATSGKAEMDRDLFSATLDVIQNFMRTTFPLLRGKSLKTIEHGDLKILIERGKFCYIAVVLEGEENDLLRRQMRDELQRFEDLNRTVLAKWRGIQQEAVGADDMLQRILKPPEMFPT